MLRGACCSPSPNATKQCCGLVPMRNGKPRNCCGPVGAVPCSPRSASPALWNAIRSIGVYSSICLLLWSVLSWDGCAKCHSSTNPGHLLASRPSGQGLAKVLVSISPSGEICQEKMSFATFEKPCEISKEAYLIKDILIRSTV